MGHEFHGYWSPQAGQPVGRAPVIPRGSVTALQVWQSHPDTYMRTLAALALVLASATPAAACPDRVTCAALLSSGATARPDATPPASALWSSLATFSPERPDDLEMPWIWKVVAVEVKKRLPRYDEDARKFSMVLSPVVVAATSNDDTVPGVGLSGDF